MVISGNIDVTVEGLNLTHGNASGQLVKGWVGHNGGGGLYIWQANAVISGTGIIDNSAKQGNKQGSALVLAGILPVRRRK
ncbi:MAG: hypothetical protein JXA42_23005 [Anaerolineales bacterium]|nr:hypothetical protein [Anaerolineales bacterium]